ncbi:MAG: heme ABC exporter ATP-binding protein CcmA [Methylocystis sp.]|nr:heme ABC exporter ATP-binding protein CcmA [Methylocystis sp.]
MTNASAHPHAARHSLRLRVDHLCVDRGGRRVLSNLSFSVASGEALVVTGRNGVGKSTLLRAVAGLLPKAEGAIELDGAESGELCVLAHYLAHVDGLKAALTVEENLDFWARFLGGDDETPKPTTIADALSRVGLAHVAQAPVAILSAGQKRRVALARLLVAWRPLWLLDEPSSALDLASRERLARIMAEHRACGGMIVAAAHEPLGLADARELSLEGAT